MKNNSINKRLFKYLTGFVIFIIVLLFIMQTVALEGFYKTIKRNEISKIANYISENVEKEDDIYDYADIQEYMVDLFYYQNVCVILYDKDGNIIFKNFHKSFRIDDITKKEISSLYDNTNKNFSKQEFSLQEKLSEPPDRGLAQPINSQNEFLLFSKVNDEKEFMVVVESILTPVNATKSILKVQILYVSIILIISATLLAYILAKKIANPIVKINKSAKKLIDGSYDLVLDKSDYTEIQELNETMLSTAIELKKADKMQKDLIANISHDLRTPLTMIIGYAEVMRDIPNENNRENIQIIIDEATRLNNLVNDILLVSKLQNDSQINLEKINLTKLIKEIIERARKMTQQNEFIFEFLYDKEIFVEIDELKISQVIYNLLGNAITHTGNDKRITIRQDIFENKVKISVIDTGAGIAEEDINNIWDRYYKVDKYHNRANVGTGLGLSIVKDIIKSHKGSYGVKSELNKGSEFWFELNI